ncbi:MAG TPA: TauD/TfdA family dioxygenase [Micromonosporaceae bacterium]|jgi:hypothetical protein|nr:TauD/TfdA family dioxygenase [Micromonosporaceae bacterium]
MTANVRIVCHRLDNGVRDLLGKEIVERIAVTELDSDADEAILAGIGAHSLRRYLPGEILDALRVFTATRSHVLLLRNLPEQDFPPTPVTGFGVETELAVTNALHFGLIQLLGLTPFAVRYENDGRLIRNVVPNPAAAGVTSSWGSDSEFFWHSDNPNLPFGEPGVDPRLFIPGYLTFFVVRNEERVPTDIMAVEDAVAATDPDTLSALRAPDFSVGSAASNDVDPYGHPYVMTGVPILEFDGQGPLVRFDRGSSVGLTEPATAALDRWVAGLTAAPSEQLVMTCGDFLIFDNYRVLHRRGAFTPNPAASARWLRRCYAS